MIRFDRGAIPAFIVACVTLLTSAVVFRIAVRSLNLYLQKEPVALRNSFANLPGTLGAWTKLGEDAKYDEAVLEGMGTDQYITRSYVHGDDPMRAIHVHLAYYTGFIDAVPHVPDRCFEAGGLIKSTLPHNVDLPIDDSRWRPDPRYVHASGVAFPMITYTHPVTGRPLKTHMPLGDFTLRVTRFHSADRPDIPVFAGYFFIANGRTASSPEAVKALAFSPAERYAYYAKVQFSMSGPPDFTEEEFVRYTADLAQSLLPSLMWCLPDWAEVESRTANEADEPSA